jgi:hypothetical protein
MLVSGWIFYLNGDTPTLSHPRAARRSLPLRTRQAALVYGEDPEDQGILYLDPEGLMVFSQGAFYRMGKDSAKGSRQGSQIRSQHGSA